MSKIKCNCPCHHDPSFKHVKPCCINGYVDFPSEVIKMSSEAKRVLKQKFLQTFDNFMSGSDFKEMASDIIKEVSEKYGLSASPQPPTVDTTLLTEHWRNELKTAKEKMQEHRLTDPAEVRYWIGYHDAIDNALAKYLSLHSRQLRVDTGGKVLRWVKASERLPGTDDPGLHFRLNGKKVNGNFYDMPFETGFCVRPDCAEEYHIYKKDFDRLEWLEEADQPSPIPAGEAPEEIDEEAYRILHVLNNKLKAMADKDGVFRIFGKSQAAIAINDLFEERIEELRESKSKWVKAAMKGIQNLKENHAVDIKKRDAGLKEALDDRVILKELYDREKEKVSALETEIQEYRKALERFRSVFSIIPTFSDLYKEVQELLNKYPQ